jgi:hypothetical protein
MMVRYVESTSEDGKLCFPDFYLERTPLKDESQQVLRA